MLTPIVGLSKEDYRPDKMKKEPRIAPRPLTMNTLYSDHAISLAEFVSEEQIPSIIYKMSVEKLKDRDRKRFIRKYFEL